MAGRILLLAWLMGMAGVWLTGCGSRQDQAFEVQESSPVENSTDNSTENSEADGAEEAGTARSSDPAVTESKAAEAGTEGKVIPAEVTVYVCGAVREEGVYTLSEGSRMKDAVEMAGGFREDAAREAVNLAARISDEAQIYVPTEEEAEKGITAVTAVPAEPGKTADSADSEGKTKVNLNTAGKEELMTLPGIGESKAADILSYREQSGGFRKTEDLMQIPGIKQGVYDKLKDRITI